MFPRSHSQLLHQNSEILSTETPHLRPVPSFHRGPGPPCTEPPLDSPWAGRAPGARTEGGHPSRVQGLPPHARPSVCSSAHAQAAPPLAQETSDARRPGWRRPGQNAIQTVGPPAQAWCCCATPTSFLGDCREARRTPPSTARCIPAGKPQGMGAHGKGGSGQSEAPSQLAAWPCPLAPRRGLSRTLQVPGHLDPISLRGAAWH